MRGLEREGGEGGKVKKEGNRLADEFTVFIDDGEDRDKLDAVGGATLEDSDVCATGSDVGRLCGVVVVALGGFRVDDGGGVVICGEGVGGCELAQSLAVTHGSDC